MRPGERIRPTATGGRDVSFPGGSKLANGSHSIRSARSNLGQRKEKTPNVPITRITSGNKTRGPELQVLLKGRVGNRREEIGG